MKSPHKVETEGEGQGREGAAHEGSKGRLDGVINLYLSVPRCHSAPRDSPPSSPGASCPLGPP